MTELEKYQLIAGELAELLNQKKTEIAFLHFEIEGLRERLKEAEKHAEPESHIHSTADELGIERRAHYEAL